MVVHGEIVESLWEEDFTSVEDQQIIDDLRERFKLLGLDPTQVEDMVRQAQRAPPRKGAPTQAFTVQPQREWEEARKRLNEQAKRLATILLNHVALQPNGTEMIYKYRSLKLSGRTNFIGALTMVNHEIAKRLGKDRDAASIEEFRSVLNSLEDILKTLVCRVRKAKADYDKKDS